MLEAGHPLNRRFVVAAKVTHYLLNLDSVDGHDKAVFFLKFGFTLQDFEVLQVALYNHPNDNPITDEWSDDWGTRFEVVGPIVSPDGRNPTILTAWIAASDGEVRFVTAYPA